MFKRLSKPKTPRSNDAAASPVVTKADRAVADINSLLKADDPLRVILLASKGPIDLSELRIASPALEKLRQYGLRMVVALISQGELTGVLGISGRRSEQDFSSDDRRMLGDFAASAGQAMRVAQLAHAQQVEAEQRTRLETELRVARTVQETLLPNELPNPAGWHFDAYWKPAREMSGDFYDFIPLHDGRIGIVVADVTDKGMPAAMVMATTRSLLRALAQQTNSPGEVLKQTNEALCPNIPPRMFVTCLYAVLDPGSGTLHYANAGHNLPVLHHENGIEELVAAGMPLGLLSGMQYEESRATVRPGDRLLIYSDGLTEAHNPAGEMFGFPRLRDVLGKAKSDDDPITLLREQLDAHVGPNWEQEDDVTFVSLSCLPALAVTSAKWRQLATFAVPSVPGNEREVMTRVAALVAPLFPPTRLEQLKTAVAEATMNAMEHGNGYSPVKPTEVEVCQSNTQVIVRITDQDGDEVNIPVETSPNLEAKLAGLQSTRGWGLFLIRNMVDDMRHVIANRQHTLELVMNLEA